jgi:hypothetical protein
MAVLREHSELSGVVGKDNEAQCVARFQAELIGSVWAQACMADMMLRVPMAQTVSSADDMNSFVFSINTFLLFRDC